MSIEPNYLFLPDQHSIRICDDNAQLLLGTVDVQSHPYRVKDPDNTIIARVDELRDALPVLIEHHERHPGRWEQGNGMECVRDTLCGLLSVKQNALGYWSVYRTRQTVSVLLCRREPASFATADEAKAAADAHLHDDVGAAGADGFEWLDTGYYERPYDLPAHA